MGELIIWWLSGQCCRDYMETVDRNEVEGWIFPNEIPHMLRDELISRNGRGGRMGLWINHRITDMFQDLEWTSEMAFKAAALFAGQDVLDQAGIVMWRHDIPRVAHIGGIFTDRKLNQILPEQI